jgi:hypothetical protein
LSFPHAAAPSASPAAAAQIQANPANDDRRLPADRFLDILDSLFSTGKGGVRCGTRRFPTGHYAGQSSLEENPH